MIHKCFSLANIFVLLLSLVLGALILDSQPALAEGWSDDFNGPDFDAIWSKGGIGRTELVDGYAYPLSFDPSPENEGFPIADEDLPLWYGPTLLAEIPMASDFNITSIYDCVADLTEYNVGRIETRLLDVHGSQVFSFGWQDISNSSNRASVFLKGPGSTMIYHSGEAFDYSVFSDKSMTLTRTGSSLRLFVNGEEKYGGQTEIKGITGIELSFFKMKDRGILMCTPTTMRFGSISVEVTPANTPSAPTDLVCQPSDTQIQLSWGQPLDDGGLPVMGFNVYRGTTKDSITLLTSVGNGFGYNDTGLPCGVMYYYKVTAVNGMGEGVASTTETCVIVTVPGPPRNIQAITDASIVNLTWQAPLSDGGSELIAYRIYRGAQPGALTQIAELAVVFVYTDTAAQEGNLYYYSVSAVNDLGEGNMARAIEVIPGASPTVPSAPRELMAISGNTSIELNWISPTSSGNSPVTNYMIYRGISQSAIPLLTVIDNCLNYTDKELTNGQTYFYQVSAINGLGESQQSEVASGTPVTPTVPTAPLNVTIIADNSSILLNWTPPLNDGSSAITGYAVYRTIGTEAPVKIASLGTALFFTDTSSQPGVPYTYRVSAINPMGEGALSEAVTGIIPLYIMQGDGDNGTTPDGWSLNSSIATVIALVIGLPIAFLIMIRRPRLSKDPDNAVYDETDGDGADEEGSED